MPEESDWAREQLGMGEESGRSIAATAGISPI